MKSKIIGIWIAIGMLVMPFSLVFADSQVVISSPSVLPYGYAGKDYTYQFKATGGAAPYTWKSTYSQNSAEVILRPDGAFTSVGAGLKPTPGTYHESVGITDAKGIQYGSNYTYTILGDKLPSTKDYPMPYGSLISLRGQNYLVMGYKLIKFDSLKILKELGYSTKNIIKKKDSDISNKYIYTTGIYSPNVPHPWGSWLEYKGKLYYSDPSGVIPVPNREIFKSNGGINKLVVPSNKYDFAHLNSSAQPIQNNDPRVALTPSDYTPYVDNGSTPYTSTVSNNNPVANPTGSDFAANDFNFVNNSQEVSAFYDGLIQAANNCSIFKKIKNVDAVELGAKIKVSIDVELQGTENGLCKFYNEYLSATISGYTDRAMQTLLKIKTSAQIQNDLALSNQAFQNVIVGYYALCKYTTTELIKNLNDSKNSVNGGSFSISPPDLSKCTVGSKNPNSSINTSPTPNGVLVSPSASANDNQRLADIRRIMTNLELYYTDQKKYPLQATPGPIPSALAAYPGTIPTAPTPPEGTCTAAQNTYTYLSLNSGQDYNLTFCLGSITGGYAPGPHTASYSLIK